MHSCKIDGFYFRQCLGKESSSLSLRRYHVGMCQFTSSAITRAEMLSPGQNFLRKTNDKFVVLFCLNKVYVYIKGTFVYKTKCMGLPAVPCSPFFDKWTLKRSPEVPFWIKNGPHFWGLVLKACNNYQYETTMGFQ